MERADWTLIAINAAGPQGLEPVQLQKCLFLVGRNCPQIQQGAYYDFHAYNYGPFDITVYQDAEALERQGLISIRQPAWRRWGEYFITPSGQARADKLVEREVDPQVADYVRRIVSWAQGLSFETLVSTIYEHYPEFRANSVFRH